MDLRRINMHPLPTSQHFTSIRTDDDITAAVSNFLQSEGSKLHGKTWQDTTAEVTKWLAMQIQREREGWRQKTRAAMQEIENHRKEVLKFQGVLQECVEHMKLLAECCNLPEDMLEHISDNEPRKALPMYIEGVTETLNNLIEDRILCLQILRAEDQSSNASLPSLLKAYIETLKFHAERAHVEAKSRLESLENANKHSFTEMAKMKKAIHRKQEEVEKLHNKLQEIQDITMKKFQEVNELQKKEDREFDDASSQTDIPPATLGKPAAEAGATPSSLYSAPTPAPTIDQKNIQISAERLSKLRKSAKKLENSLNNALSQMDTFRKGMKPGKANPLGMTGAPKASSQASDVLTPRPFGLQHLPDVPPSLKKEMKLLPSPMHMWSTKIEVSGPKVHDAELEKIKQQEREKEERKRKAKERRREALQNSQEKLLNSQDAPTFRSLMKSLDEVKKNKSRNFKPMGQVTKCLRCNKLFTLNDNHKKSCNYHPKGKERIEQYSDRGKLVKVSYVWKCCMMGPDNPGCIYGQHI